MGMYKTSKRLRPEFSPGVSSGARNDNLKSWTLLNALWEMSLSKPFLAINRSGVIFHVRERTQYKNKFAFIGWRENKDCFGFPEYYFDNVGAYWKRYK